MKGSLSAGSISAPHLAILSISFVHAALLNRCCTMMRDSWHSVHVVVTLLCTGAAGNSFDCAQVSGAARRSRAVLITSRFDTDLYLIDGIVQIPAWVPRRMLRL